MISFKTIWRTFESCNNYSMPEHINLNKTNIEYWFAESEEKQRKWDIAYTKKRFPHARIRRISNVGHGGLAALYPERLMKGIEQVIFSSKNKKEGRLI